MLCVSISEKNIHTVLDILKQVEMAEIRIDLIEPSAEELTSIVKAHNNLIATCRKGKLNDEERMVVIKHAIDAGVAYVDIEIDAPAAFTTEMVKYAKQKGCKVILSYHDFEATPDYPELIDIIDDCFVTGADIAKIATYCESQSDAARLMGLYENYDNIVVLGMGEIGKITRVASLLLGAPFTFAALNNDSTTAPGQLSIENLKNIYKLIN